MNSPVRVLILSLVLWLVGEDALGETRRLVQGDRINVRSQPSVDAEILATLKGGQEVEVLGEVSGTEPGQSWSRVAMPQQVTVWVLAQLVNRKTSVVRSKELHYRAGPGRNYSVLGTLKSGDEVKVVREFDGWLQIEPPAGSVAFVASRLLAPVAGSAVAPSPSRPQAPEPSPEPSLTPVKTPPPIAAVPTVPPPPAPAPRVDPPVSVAPAAVTPPPLVPAKDPVASPVETAPSESSAPAMLPLFAPKPKKDKPVSSRRLAPTQLAVPRILGTPRVLADLPETDAKFFLLTHVDPPFVVDTFPPRFVVRQGKVFPSLSVQAPTAFELRAGSYREGAIDYLLPPADVRLKDFAGKRVLVSGYEYRDPRWRLPVLKIEQVEEDR